ncbi:RDD family protein [Solilutibacter silvestris]|uniref:RDD family protein n=1 Tax=Solilutibacter silvestris TaxID=1645665 RepID=UPI003D3557A8
MTEWYYADRQGQQRGPVQSQELLALRNAGQIGLDTLVWRNGMANWQAFSTVANEVLPPTSETASPMQGMSMYEMATPAPSTPVEAAPAPSPVAAPAAGSYSMYETATPVAQANDPYAAPRATISATNALPVLGGHVVDAGFWKRVAAYIIDGLLLGIAGYAIQLPLLMAIGFGAGMSSKPDFGVMTVVMLILAYLIPIAMQMTYYAWFHAGERQATLGKRAIGIKVTGMQGERISFARGVGRYFALILSGLPLGIGYIMAAFTERKQALHDMIASTYVVDQWAYTDHPDRQDETLGTLTKVIIGIGIALFALFFLAMCAAIVLPALNGR